MSAAPRTDAQVLGEAITVLRQNLLITVETAAAQLGCDADRLRRYEDGRLPLAEAAQVLASLACGFTFLVLAMNRHHHLPGQTMRVGQVADPSAPEERMI